jgi:3-hydroxybutyrate dehydrogenase
LAYIIVDFLYSLAGQVHILVNCAGIQTMSPIESFPEEKFRFMNELMLVAPFLLTQAFLPSMYAAKWGECISTPPMLRLRANLLL